MKPATFDYYAPRTVDECLELLASLGGDAAVVSGGQSLIPLMRFRLAQPEALVSLRRLHDELGGISVDGDTLRIGATATFHSVEQSPEVRRSVPALPASIAHIATPAVRARGTVVGNLTHADPASELPAVALMMDASIRLRSASGERLVAAADFFIGPYMTTRQDDELVVAAEFPVRSPDERFAILEVNRLPGGFALAGIAVSFVQPSSGTLRNVAVGCFGLHGTAVRATTAEAILEGSSNTPDIISEAIRGLDESLEPHGDPFGSVEYRRSAAGTLLRRAMARAAD